MAIKLSFFKFLLRTVVRVLDETSGGTVELAPGANSLGSRISMLSTCNNLIIQDLITSSAATCKAGREFQSNYLEPADEAEVVSRVDDLFMRERSIAREHLASLGVRD